MQKLGIANLKELKNIAPVEKPMGYFTRLSEASNGKDTMTGHWEMMGINTTKPFITFTETGFPKELIAELEKRTQKLADTDVTVEFNRPFMFVILDNESDIPLYMGTYTG